MMIYIVKLTNEKESILKLGYTGNTTTSNRFQGYKRAFDKVELLKVWDNDSERNLKLLEKDLNTVHLCGLKITPKTSFGGFTECYDIKDYPIIISEVEHYMGNKRYDIGVEELTYRDFIPDPTVEVELTLWTSEGVKTLESSSLEIFDYEALFKLKTAIDEKLSCVDREVISNNCNQYRKFMASSIEDDLHIISRGEYENFLKQ